MAIFTGKRKRHNESILKNILYGEKTTMELAQHIAEKEGLHKKTAFSVIGRKDGALDRLNKKEFIVRNPDKKWHLTFKGTATALTLVDIPTIYPVIGKSLQEFDFTKSVRPLQSILGEFFRESLIQELVNWFKSEEFWKLLKQKTEQLRDKGVNIEDMTEKEFTYTMLTQLIMDKSTQKFFKSLSKR